MTIKIHGKEYVPVNDRVLEAHADNEKISITTEFLSLEKFVCKATVVTSKGIFTGTSYANPNKTIEKVSPYEVAETSAVGRALGFAGYGIVESIASADEMQKASDVTTDGDTITVNVEEDRSCPKCGAKMVKSQAGNMYCKDKCWLK